MSYKPKPSGEPLGKKDEHQIRQDPKVIKERDSDFLLRVATLIEFEHGKEMSKEITRKLREIAFKLRKS